MTNTQAAASAASDRQRASTALAKLNMAQDDGEWWKSAPVVGKAAQSVPWEHDEVIGQRRSPAHKFIGGALDTLTFGTLDEIAAGIQTATGINSTGSYSDNLARERAEAAEGGAARVAGQVAGGFVPVVGAVSRGATSFRALTKLGAASGAAYGAGSADGDLADRAKGAAIGGATGATVGAVASKLPAAARHVVRNATPTRRFVERQAKGNRFASYDAEIVNDLRSAFTDTADASPIKAITKLPAADIGRKVSSLERRYLSGFASKVDALDMVPSAKDRLKDAINGAHTMSVKDIDALRGSVPGDAVADGIVKVQRLRELTKESNRKALGSLMKDVAVSGAVGAVTGPLGAAGAIAARLVGARVSSAPAGRPTVDKLVKQAGRYERLAERVGPSGARETADALSLAAGSAKDAKALVRQALAKARADAANDTAKLVDANKRVGMVNARDNVKPSGGFRGLVYDRTGLLPIEQDIGLLKLVTTGKITPDQQAMFLADPAKLQRGNAGNAIIDRLRSMADGGELRRDAAWSENIADAAPMGSDIRNPLAYQATAKAAQDRVSQTLATVQAETRFGMKAAADIASAVSRIGSTSDRFVADRILAGVMKKLPSKEAKEYARAALEPLTKAIRPH